MKLVFLHHWLSWILLFDLCWDIRSEAVAARTVVVGFYQNVFCSGPYPLRAEVISVAWLQCNWLLQLSPWVLLNSYTILLPPGCIYILINWRKNREENFNRKKYRTAEGSSGCPLALLDVAQTDLHTSLWSFFPSKRLAKYCLPFNLIH